MIGPVPLFDRYQSGRQITGQGIGKGPFPYTGHGAAGETGERQYDNRMNSGDDGYGCSKLKQAFPSGVYGIRKGPKQQAGGIHPEKRMLAGKPVKQGIMIYSRILR
ncbi:hypothetical protein D3C76_1642670 [compost metagenome]